MKEIIIYASFGEGHKKAAFSLSEYLQYPCLDLLDFVIFLPKKFFQKIYFFLTTKLIFLWKLLYCLSKKKVIRHLNNFLNLIFFFPFFLYLKKNKPSLVISTHFYPLFFLSFFKEKFDLKIIVVVTDLRVHPIWVDKKVDFYFVALKETKEDLINYGIEENKILKGFIPIRRGFSFSLNKVKIFEKLSIPINRSLLFVSSTRGDFSFFKKNLDFFTNFDGNLIVIVGKNKKFKKYLKEQNLQNLFIFDYYESIWELMEISNIIIGKAGGLTIFEGIFKKKFFIFTHFIPGQEEENLKIMEVYGVGRYVKDNKKLKDYLNLFFNQESFFYPLKVEILGKYLYENSKSFISPSD